MNTDNPPFSPGQKVIVIDDSFLTQSDYAIPPIKKGQIFTIAAIEMPCCRWMVDVGLRSPEGISLCGCGKWIPELSIVFWLQARRFAPITEQYSDLTNEIAESFKEVMERPDKVVVPDKVLN